MCIIHNLREDLATHRRLLLIEIEMIIHTCIKCPEGSKCDIGHIKRPSVSLSAPQKKYQNVPKDR